MSISFMYSHMHLQLESNVGTMVIMEDDMIQLSTTTRGKYEIIAKTKKYKGKTFQENVA